MYITPTKEAGTNQPLCDLITEALGERQHIKCNFVPWVLTCLACDQALAFCDAARDRRIGALRGVCREIRSNAGYYLKTAGGVSGPDALDAGVLLSLYDRKTTTDQWLAEIQAGDSARQAGADDISRHATLAMLLLLRAAEIDRNTDRKLRALTGKNIRRREESALVWLKQSLRSLAALGYLPEPNKTTKGWAQVLENKASLLADELIDQALSAG